MMNNKKNRSMGCILSHTLIMMILSILFVTANAFAAKQKIAFNYDATGTLTSAAYGPENTVTYVYDDGGNLLRRITKSGVDLADAIVILQSMAGKEYPQDHRRIDVDYNSKAGLEEAIYVLKRVAED